MIDEIKGVDQQDRCEEEIEDFIGVVKKKIRGEKTVNLEIINCTSGELQIHFVLI